MMLSIFTFINIFLLFTGVFAIIKKISAQDSEPLLWLTSMIISLVVISFLYYAMLVFSQRFITLQWFLAIVNLSHIYFTRGVLNTIFKRRPSEINAYNLLALVTVFIFTCYFVLYESKYGGWDAWAIWNLHAEFIYQPQFWHRLSSADLAYSHPDYPLMLPSVIAFFWNALKDTTPVVPILLSYGTLITIPLLLYFSLREEGLCLYAFIGLAVLLADTNYKQIACSQEADSLLSLLILMVFIQYNRIVSVSDNRIYILGFICASCAWIKNEGIVFYILFTAGYLLINYRHKQVLMKYFAGIIMPTLVIASFKLFFSPANDLVAASQHRTFPIFAALFDLKRYEMIVKFGIDVLISNYMPAVILIITAFVFNQKFFLSFTFAVIVLLLSTYFVVYLTTPYDLRWHLSTSLYRLLQHVYPALIYLLLIAVKNIKNHAPINPLLVRDFTENY
ncbi:MAG: hypothetical protein ACXVJD_04225 [Mucilaginibacter sp.]